MALTGSVSRWFNRKGYGFINVMTSDSEHVGNDLFVHLSGINVSNDGYKSLYPGEYVSFDLDTGRDGRVACVNVTGVLGGPLLIEHPEYRYKYFQRDDRQRDDRQRESNNRLPEHLADGDPVSDTVDETIEPTDGDQVDENNQDENDPEQD
jgi:cold shock CspA family protein